MVCTVCCSHKNVEYYMQENKIIVSINSLYCKIKLPDHRKNPCTQSNYMLYIYRMSVKSLCTSVTIMYNITTDEKCEDYHKKHLIFQKVFKVNGTL